MDLTLDQITESLSERACTAYEQVARSGRRSNVQWIVGTSLCVTGFVLLSLCPHIGIGGFASVETFGMLLLRYSRLSEQDCKYYLQLHQSADTDKAAYYILRTTGHKESLLQYALRVSKTNDDSSTTPPHKGASKPSPDLLSRVVELFKNRLGI